MQDSKEALSECKRQYNELCLMKDITQADTLFTGVLVTLMDETIASIDERHDAFENDVARRMIISIFEDIKIEIHREYCTSDTTISAAKHLLEIAVSEQLYRDELNKILTYINYFGFRAIIDGPTGSENDDSEA